MKIYVCYSNDFANKYICYSPQAANDKVRDLARATEKAWWWRAVAL